MVLSPISTSELTSELERLSKCLFSQCTVWLLQVLKQQQKPCSSLTC